MGSRALKVALGAGAIGAGLPWDSTTYAHHIVGDAHAPPRPTYLLGPPPTDQGPYPAAFAPREGALERYDAARMGNPWTDPHRYDAPEGPAAAPTLDVADPASYRAPQSIYPLDDLEAKRRWRALESVSATARQRKRYARAERGKSIRGGGGEEFILHNQTTVLILGVVLSVVIMVFFVSLDNVRSPTVKNKTVPWILLVASSAVGAGVVGFVGYHLLFTKVPLL